MGSYKILKLGNLSYPKENLRERVVKMIGLQDHYGTARYNVNQYHEQDEITAVVINQDGTFGKEMTLKEVNGKPISDWAINDIIEDN